MTITHGYAVYGATGTKADNHASCRHYASICSYTLLYGILPLIRLFTLPMFQVGKLGQKSGCLGAISIILAQYEVYENLDMQYSVTGYSGYAIAP